MNKANVSSCARWLFGLILGLFVIPVSEGIAQTQQWITAPDGTIYNNNTGNVGIGTAGVTSPATNLEVVSTTPTGGVRNIANSQYSSDAGGAQWNARKARGTPSAPTSILSGDVVSNLIGWGYDGTGFGLAASIGAIANENFSSTSHGTYLGFSTTANGSTSTLERMRIDNAGNVGVGTTAPAANFEVVSASSTFSPRNITNSQYSSDTAGAQWNGRKARGTPLAPTAILSGDIISNLFSWGYDGTAFNFVGAIRAIADENFSPTSHGAHIDFFTTANGTTVANERMRIDNAGNVGIGTTSPTSRLTVSGDITSTGNIIATGNISAKYQDVAEWVPSKTKISAGTVVVLDREAFNSVEPSSGAYDTRVAGVVSAEPGIVLGEPSDQKVKVATTGRVRVHVDASHGAIHVGDLLVTSEKPGTAMKSIPIEVGGIQIHRPGTLIGKALESLEAGEGDILVLLSLQ